MAKNLKGKGTRQEHRPEKRRPVLCAMHQSSGKTTGKVFFIAHRGTQLAERAKLSETAYCTNVCTDTGEQTGIRQQQHDSERMV